MNTLSYGVLALSAVVCALFIGYRLGSAAMRPVVDSLREQLNERDDVIAAVTPLREAMSTLRARVDDAERSRLESLARLSEQVIAMGRQVGTATSEVRQEAQRIATALSRTQHQGTWGEMQLRRVVEASGMLEHVHFTEQVRLADGSLRPDMVIDLGAGRTVVVDAKVSLDALLSPDLDGDDVATEHARAIGDHLQRLAGKQYWKAAGTPEFVIMFLPAEHMLSVALQARPDLLQTSFDRHVVLATPTTLMATLRSISWAWQQAEMAGQARDVLEAGQLVHDRLTTMSSHLQRLGKDLAGAVNGYNQFVGSLETRVLPATRRLSGLCAPQQESLEAGTIDIRVREIVVEDTG